jgi:5-methylcytosine-specific restriction enzyme A
VSASARINILDAMADFDRHGLPAGFGEAKYYYLIHPDTSAAYPVKAIWYLATSQTSRFNAQDAKTWLEKLDFYVYDSRQGNFASEFSKAVTKAASDTSEARRARLHQAQTQPDTGYSMVLEYSRNPDVVAERLFFAKDVCEECQNLAPFMRASDGTPFLEVHHVNPLSNGGADTLANTQALCPNCHRKAHFG